MKKIIPSNANIGHAHSSPRRVSHLNNTQLLLRLCFAFVTFGLITNHSTLLAKTVTWDPTGGGYAFDFWGYEIPNEADWSYNKNWIGRSVPVSGDSLILGASDDIFRLDHVNDISNLTLGSISVTLSGWSLIGNSITLTNGIFNTFTDFYGTHSTEVMFGTTLQGAVEFNNQTGGFLASPGELYCNGWIQGSGSLLLSGWGSTFITSDWNSYSGGTTISSSVYAQSAHAFGTGSVTNNGYLNFINNYSLTITNQISSRGSINLVSRYVNSDGIPAEGRGSVTLSGLMNSTGGILVNSGGTLNLSSLTNSSGVVKISSQWNAVSATWSGGGSIFFGNGGALNAIYSSPMQISTNIWDTNSLNYGKIGFNSSGTILASGGITGYGSLQQLGTGTLILTGYNDFSGGTTIANGTIQLGNGGASDNILSIGTGPVTNNGTLSFNSSSELTSGGITGRGSVRQLGSGTTYFAQNNSYTGGTLISAGTLQLVGGTLGSGPVTNNSILIYIGNFAQIFSNSISGTGLFNIASGSAYTNPLSLILLGSNNYTGPTTIDSGTLQVGNGGAAGSIGSGNITNNGSLFFNSTASQTVVGAISGGGNLAHGGIGTLVLTGTLLHWCDHHQRRNDSSRQWWSDRDDWHR